MIELCAAKIRRPAGDELFIGGQALLPPPFLKRALEKSGTAREERFSGLLLLWKMLCRGGLGEGVSPEALEIAEGDGGKPCFPRMPNVSFSISHKGELVVCALCRCAAGLTAPPVGVDVEIVPAEAGLADRIAKRFFSLAEREALSRAENRREAFAEIWTRKESLLKWRGAGIGQIDSADTANPGEGLAFFTYRMDLSGQRYMMALCLEQGLPGPAGPEFLTI